MDSSALPRDAEPWCLRNKHLHPSGLDAESTPIGSTEAKRPRFEMRQIAEKSLFIQNIIGHEIRIQGIFVVLMTNRRN